MGLRVLQLLQSRDDALERARGPSRNLGQIAERNFELYDLSLPAVVLDVQVIYRLTPAFVSASSADVRYGVALASRDWLCLNASIRSGCNDFSSTILPSVYRI